MKSAAIIEYERYEQRLAKQRYRIAVLRNDHTHKSTKSSNEHFAISFSILGLHFCCTWMTGPKACAMPTNTNTLVSVQWLLRYVHACAEWAHKGHTLQIRTPTIA